MVIQGERYGSCRTAGPAPRAPVAVGGAELAEGAAHVQPPPVGELDVHVGVEGPLGGQPALVQYSQLLKFQRSCWKIRLGWWNARLAQLVHACWSAWRRNPMSLISKPGVRRWYAVSKWSRLPPTLANRTLRLVPLSEVRVESKVSGAVGALIQMDRVLLGRAIAAVSPATRLRSNEPDTSYRPLNRQRPFTPPL